ncbi:MAG: hypothetical protein HOO96_11660 [Polyangiaceae bacterium]|nr:hypothetical protein [Polyangiaceae bacterium]
MNRHARQERVLGREAQARLGRRTVRVQSASNAAASVEARYLAGAGVAGLEGAHGPWVEEARALDGAVTVIADDGPQLATSEEAPAWTYELSPSAGEFVRGALLALGTIRRSSG